MADLFDSLYRALTHRSPASERRPLAQRLQALERQHGSVRAAAADAGVSESTWRRWRKGQSTPKPENERKVNRAQRRAAMPEGRRRRFLSSVGRGGAGGGLTVTGWVTVSKDTRYRTLNLGAHLGPGRLDDLLDAFLTGDDDVVFVVIQDLVSEYMGYPAGVTDPIVSF